MFMESQIRSQMVSSEHPEENVKGEAQNIFYLLSILMEFYSTCFSRCF